MLKVAITGNIASGKSAVEEMLKQKGLGVLNADVVAHELLYNESIKSQIINCFKGFDIIENEEISRPKLAQIVFNDESLKKQLEMIMHPPIKDEISKFFNTMEEQGEKMAFAEVPLLFEAKFEDVFDKIILIYADDKIRIERLMRRNCLPLESAENRLKIQISQDKKISLADYVIYNNKSLDDLSANLNEVLELL